MNIEVFIIDGPLPPRVAPRAEGAGAVLCFEGVVRPTEGGRPIEALDYEVYEPMASRMLKGLAEEVGREFALLAVHVEHSRGRVAAGACSFRLCISSGHRKEGLEAMGRFIDRMKQDVPIWKRAV